MCLCLKEFFLDPEVKQYQEDEEEERNIFHPPSNRMPPKGSDGEVDTYVKIVRQETLRQLQHLKTKRVKKNLYPARTTGANDSLAKAGYCHQTCRKRVSSSGTKKSDYMHEAERQLGNKNHYLKIEKDPTPFIPQKSKTCRENVH